jgi:RimJ/RimL family protein N-acetyltransferase
MYIIESCRSRTPCDACLVISTDRLLLRAPRSSDAAEVVTMMADPDNARWNGNPTVVDEPSALDWIDDLADWSDGTHVSFMVVDLATGRPAGTVSVHSINRVQSDGEIGYRTAAWARGRGYASEAVRAASTWAFAELDLVRIELAHAVANAASCAVATRSGYRLEGVLRSSYVYGDGQRYDEHLHARLATDA